MLKDDLFEQINDDIYIFLKHRESTDKYQN